MYLPSLPKCRQPAGACPGGINLNHVTWRLDVGASTSSRLQIVDGALASLFMAPLSPFRYLRMVRSSLFHAEDQLNTYTLFNSTVRLIMNGTKRKSPDGGDISPPPLKRKAIGTATSEHIFVLKRSIADIDAKY